MATLQLSIVTPSGKIFDEEIVSVAVPGAEGSFGVYVNHAPLVALLSRGVVKVARDQQTEFYSIGAGIFEINHINECVLLTSEAIAADTVEAAKANLKQITD